MTKRTAIYVVCDYCGDEKELTISYAPNEKFFNEGAKLVGFGVKNGFHYCSLSCKAGEPRRQLTKRFAQNVACK